MLIHVPFYIAIDVSAPDPIYSNLMNAVERKTMTLRFCTENHSIPVEATDHHPPRPNAVWAPATALIDFMGHRAWNSLLARVAMCPMDYAADPTEAVEDTERRAA